MRSARGRGAREDYGVEQGKGELWRGQRQACRSSFQHTVAKIKSTYGHRDAVGNCRSQALGFHHKKRICVVANGFLFPNDLIAYSLIFPMI